MWAHFCLYIVKQILDQYCQDERRPGRPTARRLSRRLSLAPHQRPADLEDLEFTVKDIKVRGYIYKYLQISTFIY